MINRLSGAERCLEASVPGQPHCGTKLLGVLWGPKKPSVCQVFAGDAQVSPYPSTSETNQALAIKEWLHTAHLGRDTATQRVTPRRSRLADGIPATPQKPAWLMACLPSITRARRGPGLRAWRCHPEARIHSTALCTPEQVTHLARGPLRSLRP